MVLQEQENPTTKQSSSSRKYNCAECEKGFDSGKALGGHMSSAHVQPTNDLKRNKNGKHKSLEEIFERICKVCGKEFPSIKSVCGHLRTHPEREWRGMKPPPGSKIRSPESKDSPNTSTDDYYHCGFNDDRVDTGPIPAVDLNQASKSRPDPDFSNPGLVNEEDPGKNREKNQGPDFCDAKEKAESGEPGTLSALESSSEATKEPDFNSNNADSVPDNQSEPDLKNTCDTCGAKFPTHQALGGHVASHKKFIIRIHNTADHQRKEATEKKKKTKKRSNSSSTTVTKEVESRIVTSEQGDNTTSPVLENNKTVAITVPVIEGEEACSSINVPEKTKSARKRLCFDLNEMAKDEDGDEDVVCS